MVFSQRTMKNILEKGILLRREQGFKGNSLVRKYKDPGSDKPKRV